MNEAIKHKILAHLADAYRNASLHNENMIEFSKLTESFRVNFISAHKMSKAWDCLDNYLGAAYDNKMQSPAISTFRNKFISEIIETLALKVEHKFDVSKENGITEFWNTYFEFIFGWHLTFAGSFLTRCYVSLKKAGIHIRELLQFSLLIEQARWVETFPIIDKLKNNKQISKKDKANLLALEAAIELHYVGNISAAKECVMQAFDLSTNEEYPFELEGRILSEEKKYEEARVKFNAMGSRFPDSIQYKINIGSTWERENLPQLALQVYNEILITNPGNINSLQNRILLINTANDEKEKRLSEINSFTEKILFIEPESAYDAYTRAALAHENTGDYADAEKWYQKAIDLNKVRPEAYNSLGQMLVRQINNDDPTGNEANTLGQKATTYFLKSIELAPGLLDGYWNLALLQLKQKAYSASIETLDNCFPHCPKFQRLIHMQKCYLYQELKDWEKAGDALLAAASMYNGGDPISNFIDDSVKFYRDQLLNNNEQPEPIFTFLEKLKKILPANALEYYYKLELEMAISFHKKDASFSKTLNDAVAQFPSNDFFVQQKIEWLDSLPEAKDEKSATIMEAHHRFPDKPVFTDWLRKDFYGSVYESLADPKPIYVDCHESIVHLFLDTVSNDLLNHFLDKIDAFRVKFMEHFGLHIPGIQFRLFNSDNEYYDFYTSIDEVIVVAGNKIKTDSILVNTPVETLEKAGIAYQTPVYPYPVLPLFWIGKEDIAKAKSAGIQMYEPIEFILFHLQVQVWHHMHRFIRFYDNEIMTLLEKEPLAICRSFMTLLQLLLEHKAPVIRKDVLLIRLKMGMEKRMNLQQIAAEIMQEDEFQPKFFLESKFNLCYRIGAGINNYISESLGYTVQNNWFVKIKPEACQEILAAFRDIKNPHDAIIEVPDQESSWSLSTITKMEFPYLRFAVPSQIQKLAPDAIVKEIDIY